MTQKSTTGPVRRVAVAVGAAGLAVAGLLAVPATAHADSYARAGTTTVSGRTVTLWFNRDTGLWHGEISGAAPGDTVHLDYQQSTSEAYSVASASVGSGGGAYANTADIYAAYRARACGFVGSASSCTGWHLFTEFAG